MLQGCDPRPFVRETGPEQTAKAVCQSYVPVESIAPWETTTPDPPIMLTVEIPRLSTGVLVQLLREVSLLPLHHHHHGQQFQQGRQWLCSIEERNEGW